MAPPNLLQLAQQGDPEAITTLMNRVLQPKGATAEVRTWDNCLHIFVSSTRTLNQSALASFIRRGMESLGVGSVQTVKVYGIKVGEESPVWTDEFEVSSATQFSQTTIPSVTSSSEIHSSQPHSTDTAALEPVVSQSLLTENISQARVRPSRLQSTLILLILPAFLLGIVIAVVTAYVKSPSSAVNLGVVFLTGLTAGGLSCMAVQGGLLASSIAREVEQNLQYRSAVQPRKSLAQPILLFLGAKLVAYTLLGFLLGWLGSVLQLTPLMRGILQIAIGVFMMGTALRMFNVHPIFRIFVVEPPAFLTRYIRRTAKKGGDAIVTPLFLGALTVLIPCGVTQAIMALAIGTGSPIQAAAIMAAFTLGTSPVFFTLAYLVTTLGRRLEKRFLQVMGVAVLLLGLLSLDAGLNLVGSPISFANLNRTVKSAMQAPSQPMSDSGSQAMPNANAESLSNTDSQIPSNDKSNRAASSNVLTINVVQGGYTPEVLRAKAGQPVKLVLVTNNVHSCALAFVLPSLNVEKLLPPTGKTVINIPAQAAGRVPFTCSMGMFQGYIEFQA